MPNSRPTVTDEHISKYNAIMQTPVKSNAMPSATQPPAPAASSMSQILANLPKPKGIGNKMFIFTGKKKIIMDGTQKEVETIKTVDAKQTPEEKKSFEVKTPPPDSKSEAVTEAPKVHAEEKKQKPADQKTKSSKKLPTSVLVAAVSLFIIAWLLFWLVFLGFISF